MISDQENSGGPAPAKKPYQKPEFRSERVFETTALACTKLSQNSGCQPTKKLS